jgi:hypothetical protein
MKPDDTTTPLSLKLPAIAPKNKKRLSIVIGIVGIVLLAAIIVIVVLLSNRQSPEARQRDAFKIGSHDYAYACSTFTRDEVADTFKITDKSKLYITTADARRTSDQTIDLLSLTQDTKNYFSDCRYEFNVTAFDNNGPKADNSVLGVVVQYADNKAAQEGTNGHKAQQSNATPLAGFSEPAYFASNTIEGSYTASGFLALDNLELIVHANLKTADETQNRTFITEALHKAVTRVQNKQAYTPSDFTNTDALNNQPFTDVCATVDAVALGKRMPNVELRPTAVLSLHNLTELPTQDDPITNLQSFCFFNFRTTADANAQAKYESTLSYDDRYIHLLRIRKNTFGSEQDAIKDLTSTRETLQKPAANDGERPKPIDVAIGNKAMKVVLNFDDGSDVHYYIQKDNTTYDLMVSTTTKYQTKDQKEFESKGYEVKDDIMKAVFEQIHADTKVQ